MQLFRGGLVFKARRLCVSPNSRLESNKENEEEEALHSLPRANEAQGTKEESPLALGRIARAEGGQREECVLTTFFAKVVSERPRARPHLYYFFFVTLKPRVG